MPISQLNQYHIAPYIYPKYIDTQTQVPQSPKRYNKAQAASLAPCIAGTPAKTPCMAHKP